MIGLLLLGLQPAMPVWARSQAHFVITAPVGGTYHPLTPARILDTRFSSRLGQGGTINVQITGKGGVPATGVSAVVLNVTATDISQAGFLTVYPQGGSVPLASNLNFNAGQTVPNLVTVGLGSTGQITVYNGLGSVDIVLDVAGYYTDPASSPGPDGLFNPLVPSRLLDTRTGNGVIAAGMLAPSQKIDLQVTGRGGVPSSGVSAVVMNVTDANASSAGFLTVWPTGVTMPLASNLNFVAGQTVPNRVMVGVGTAGKVSIYNGLASSHVIADVNGWFTDGTAGGTGSRFTPVAPTRLLDSRLGTGGYFTAWGPNSGRAVIVAGQAGVPLMTDPNPPTAVVANVTVTDTSQASALIAWPDGAAQPLASDLNWNPGVTVPNLVVAQVGPTGKVDRGRLVHRSYPGNHAGAAAHRHSLPVAWRWRLAVSLQLLPIDRQLAARDRERGVERRRLQARAVHGPDPAGHSLRAHQLPAIHARRRPGGSERQHRGQLDHQLHRRRGHRFLDGGALPRHGHDGPASDTVGVRSVSSDRLWDMDGRVRARRYSRQQLHRRDVSGDVAWKRPDRAAAQLRRGRVSKSADGMPRIQRAHRASDLHPGRRQRGDDGGSGALVHRQWDRARALRDRFDQSISRQQPDPARRGDHHSATTASAGRELRRRAHRQRCAVQARYARSVSCVVETVELPSHENRPGESVSRWAGPGWASR